MQAPVLHLAAHRQADSAQLCRGRGRRGGCRVLPGDQTARPVCWPGQSPQRGQRPSGRPALQRHGTGNHPLDLVQETFCRVPQTTTQVSVSSVFSRRFFLLSKNARLLH